MEVYMAKNTKTKVKKNQVVEKKVTSKKILLWIFLVLLVVAIALGLKSFFPCNHLNKEDFKITSFDGKKQKALFRLEIADTEATRLKGLMYRKELPENTGMIFDFEKPDYYAMWMKNTYISLDMIFIGCDNKVKDIYKKAKPLSLERINSNTDFCYVLEINGGLADKKNITIGDNINFNPKLIKCLGLK
jgi:uncharacterized membrane protein (UPF0127 family)